jgi:mannosidase alpha-like ER degradation enhancer 1
LKAYVLFGEKEYFDVFQESYKAVNKWIKDPNGFLYKNIDMESGDLRALWVDSLSAFWPGMQVLAGDLEGAMKSHQFYFTIWRRFHAMPERFDFRWRSVNLPHYPLRPELIESTYMLYQVGH